MCEEELVSVVVTRTVQYLMFNQTQLCITDKSQVNIRAQIYHYLLRPLLCPGTSQNASA